MLLLDTCAVLWLGRGEQVAESALVAMERAREAGDLLVSAVSAWEIGLGATRKRAPLDLRPTAKDWLLDFIARADTRVLELSPMAALDAAFLPEPFHRDPADRLLVAQAREVDAPLVTRDRRILDYAELGHVQALAC